MKNDKTKFTPGPWHINRVYESEYEKTEWNRKTQTWDTPKRLSHICIETDTCCPNKRVHTLVRVHPATGTSVTNGESCMHDLPIAANAALIASAPEMYEALKLAERAMHVQAETRGCKVDMITALKNTRDALNKAKGKK